MPPSLERSHSMLAALSPACSRVSHFIQVTIYSSPLAAVSFVAEDIETCCRVCDGPVVSQYLENLDELATKIRILLREGKLPEGGVPMEDRAELIRCPDHIPSLPETAPPQVAAAYLIDRPNRHTA